MIQKNKFFQAVVSVGGVNAGIFLLSFLIPPLFILFFLAVALEFLAGLLMLLRADTRERGLAFLVVSGVCLLIGFSVCSTMTWNMH